MRQDHLNRKYFHTQLHKTSFTPGGTKDFSLNSSALSKYYLSAEYGSFCIRNLRQLTNVSHCRWQHPDLDPYRLAKDEQAISSCVVLLWDSWINLFEGSIETLVSLSCGITVPKAVSSDLLDAHSRGEAAYALFNDRLFTGKGFYD